MAGGNAIAEFAGGLNEGLRTSLMFQELRLRGRKAQLAEKNAVLRRDYLQSQLEALELDKEVKEYQFNEFKLGEENRTQQRENTGLKLGAEKDLIPARKTAEKKKLTAAGLMDDAKGAEAKLKKDLADKQLQVTTQIVEQKLQEGWGRIEKTNAEIAKMEQQLKERKLVPLVQSMQLNQQIRARIQAEPLMANKARILLEAQSGPQADFWSPIKVDDPFLKDLSMDGMMRKQAEHAIRTNNVVNAEALRAWMVEKHLATKKEKSGNSDPLKLAGAMIKADNPNFEMPEDTSAKEGDKKYMDALQKTIENFKKGVVTKPSAKVLDEKKPVEEKPAVVPAAQKKLIETYRSRLPGIKTEESFRALLTRAKAEFGGMNKIPQELKGDLLEVLKAVKGK